MDADSNGSAFDDLTAGAFLGNNATGTPAYLRHPPVQDFDDLNVYIGGNELSAHVCEYLDLAVNNHSSATARVFDASQGAYLGSISSGGTAAYVITSATRIEVHDIGGNIVASTPPTPITLAGQGATIDIP
jgi:hypothetical protein